MISTIYAKSVLLLIVHLELVSTSFSETRINTSDHVTQGSLRTLAYPGSKTRFPLGKDTVNFEDKTSLTPLRVSQTEDRLVPLTSSSEIREPRNIYVTNTSFLPTLSQAGDQLDLQVTSDEEASPAGISREKRSWDETSDFCGSLCPGRTAMVHNSSLLPVRFRARVCAVQQPGGFEQLSCRPLTVPYPFRLRHCASVHGEDCVVMVPVSVGCQATRRCH